MAKFGCPGVTSVHCVFVSHAAVNDCPGDAVAVARLDRLIPTILVLACVCLSPPLSTYSPSISPVYSLVPPLFPFLTDTRSLWVCVQFRAVLISPARSIHSCVYTLCR